MKKKTIAIIGIGILFTIAFLWGVLSLDEFYKDGQSLPLWYYTKQITTDKLIDLSISLIPVPIMLYYAFKKTKKTA